MPEPVKPLPTDLQTAIERIRELELENVELKTLAANSVGGFLKTNVTEKVILGIVAIVLAALGGGNLVSSYFNHDKITAVENGQKQAVAEVTEKIDESKATVGEKVDDVKREVIKRKPPVFAPEKEQ